MVCFPFSVKGRTSSNVTPAKGSAAPMSARKAALNTPLRPLVLTGKTHAHGLFERQLTINFLTI